MKTLCYYMKQVLLQIVAEISSHCQFKQQKHVHLLTRKKKRFTLGMSRNGSDLSIEMILGKSYYLNLQNQNPQTLLVVDNRINQRFRRGPLAQRHQTSRCVSVCGRRSH